MGFRLLNAPITVDNSVPPSKNGTYLNLTSGDYFPPDNKGVLGILTNWDHQEDEASLFHLGVVAFCAE